MKTRIYILILCAVLLLSVGTAWFLGGRTPSQTLAGVYQNGELIFIFDLSCVTEPEEITLQNNGYSCVVRVDQKGIRIVSSTCPEQICVEHGVLGSGPPIVCLPNELVIRWIKKRYPQ